MYESLGVILTCSANARHADRWDTSRLTVNVLFLLKQLQRKAGIQGDEILRVWYLVVRRSLLVIVRLFVVHAPVS
jgi:hypothetical protein